MNFESLKAKIYDFEVALDGLKQELKKLEDENRKDQELEKEEETVNDLQTEIVVPVEQGANTTEEVEIPQQEVNEEQLPQEVVPEVNEEEKESAVVTPVPPAEITQSEVTLAPIEVSPLTPIEKTNTVANSQQEFSKIDTNNPRGIILNAIQASNTRNNGIQGKETISNEVKDDVDKQLEVMFDQLAKTTDEVEANLINDKIKVLQSSKAA